MSAGPSRRGSRSDRLTLLFVAGAAIALVVLVAALVARSPGSSKQGSEPAGSVHVAPSKFGRILVDARGRTLYLFVADSHGRSACDAACAKVWPPLLVSGSTRAGSGVSAQLLTKVRRADGSEQVVYHHHPLYYMVADKRPGQAAGQAFLGTWFVVSPHGNAITGGVKPSKGEY